MLKDRISDWNLIYSCYVCFVFICPAILMLFVACVSVYNNNNNNSNNNNIIMYIFDKPQFQIKCLNHCKILSSSTDLCCPSHSLHGGICVRILTHAVAGLSSFCFLDFSFCIFDKYYLEVMINIYASALFVSYNDRVSNTLCVCVIELFYVK